MGEAAMGVESEDSLMAEVSAAIEANREACPAGEEWAAMSAKQANSFDALAAPSTATGLALAAAGPGRWRTGGWHRWPWRPRRRRSRRSGSCFERR